jgi:hypothetical protein
MASLSGHDLHVAAQVENELCDAAHCLEPFTLWFYASSGRLRKLIYDILEHHGLVYKTLLTKASVGVGCSNVDSSADYLLDHITAVHRVKRAIVVSCPFGVGPSFVPDLELVPHFNLVKCCVKEQSLEEAWQSCNCRVDVLLDTTPPCATRIDLPQEQCAQLRTKQRYESL